MSNEDIYEIFQETYPELNPIDYRPLSTLHEPKTPGIQIWLENGDIVLYFPKFLRTEVITVHKYHDPFGNPIYVYVRVGDKTVAIKADDLQKALDYVTKNGEEVTIEGRMDATTRTV